MSVTKMSAIKSRWVIRDEAALNRVFGEIRTLIVPGKPYDVIFRNFTQRRTIPQNSRMWAMFGAIADYSGDDIQSVHDEMCYRFLGTEAYTILGKAHTRPVGTSGLTREQMTKFMDQLQVFCDEWGVEWGEEEHA